MAATILIVDDDREVRETLRDVLLDEGFEVHVAADGEHAFRMIDGGLRPNLILLDLMMPLLDGVEFRAAQQVDPRIAAVPVVFISATSTRPSSVDLGGAPLVAKPFDLDELLQAVTDALASAAAS